MNHFANRIIGIHQQDIGSVPRRLLVGQLRPMNNDHPIARRGQVCSSAVDSNRAAPGLSTKNISFKPRPRVTVCHEYRVVNTHPRLLKEVGVNRDRSLVIGSRLGHHRLVDFAMENFSNHALEYTIAATSFNHHSGIRRDRCAGVQCGRSLLVSSRTSSRKEAEANAKIEGTQDQHDHKILLRKRIGTILAERRK